MFALGAAQEGPDTATYFGFNLGYSAAKTSLGASWAKGSDQWNIGFLVPPHRDDGFTVMVPGVTYNRRLTPGNFFASAAVYIPHTIRESGRVSLDSISGAIRTDSLKSTRGWDTPLLMLGGGKVFQFQRWGIHADANVYTPLDSRAGRSRGWLVGAGLSFRGLVE